MALNIMNKRTFILLAMLFLSACSHTENPSKTVTTVSLTIPALLSSTPTAAASHPLILEVNQACVKTVPPKKSNQGVLVFKQNAFSRFIFQDAQAGTLKYVQSENNGDIFDGVVSPNQKSLFYTWDANDVSGKARHILTDASGIPQIDIPFDFIFESSDIFWLNDKVLRIAELDIQNKAVHNFSFDPVSGKKTSLADNLPAIMGNKNIHWIDPLAISIGIVTGTNIVYDPTLTHVLYPKENGLISLYDLETNTQIAETTISGWGRLPKWSPDGKYLAIIGTMSTDPAHEDLDEFLLVSRDGPEFQRLTQFTSVFKSVHIERYSWSPNGQRVAFWLKTENTSSDNPANPFELAVLDFQAGQITMQCLTGTPEIEFDAGGYSRDADLIWSPDGTQLLVAQYTSKDKKKFHVMLVDLAEKTAYEVAQNMYQVGWMTKEP
jgi:hypothetical protein